MMKSRKERKLEAKQNGVQFVPQYNGNGAVSFEDFYGLGNERFNNKFVKFDKKVEEKIADEFIDSYKEHVQERLVEIDKTDSNNNNEGKIEVDETELVVEQPKKKGKFKKVMKKLFNK
ncbi:hypothetical protein FJQ98_15805 [Lysinibacillus agricola]|uniref:Uncharacterized protein n=1 Tax=Lysinibacillus agricola TaxID=2590012 RepID=A0ABX7ALE0_9BACI|nr:MULTISPECIES: hypothetical protein [Lysinibacillus]KOS60376.1 hypothetical protein AN161_23640 [Lysinibacillus sp. FJAT-14222]QQP10711.1 hypothetical protein FJQ98_15805 [Lysinibacillus agricola]